MKDCYDRLVKHMLAKYSCHTNLIKGLNIFHMSLMNLVGCTKYKALRFFLYLKHHISTSITQIYNTILQKTFGKIAREFLLSVKFPISLS